MRRVGISSEILDQVYAVDDSTALGANCLHSSVDDGRTVQQLVIRFICEKMPNIRMHQISNATIFSTPIHATKVTNKIQP